jgi:hypothetical protein
LPCRIEIDPDVGIGGHLDDGIIDGLYKKPGNGVKPRVIVPDQGRRPWIEGALHRRSEGCRLLRGGACPLHLHLAVMGSIASAAGRQIRLRVRREREQRRCQRKAEEQQQRKCQETAHTAIVDDDEAAYIAGDKICIVQREFIDQVRAEDRLRRQD